MTRRTLVITAYGPPAPQGSKRHVGNGRMIESSKRVMPWRQTIGTVAQSAIREWEGHRPLDAGIGRVWEPIDSAVEVSIELQFQRPRSHYGTGRNAGTVRDGAPIHPTARWVGDIDKHARAVLDALTLAGVIADDSLVVALSVSKAWSYSGVSVASIRVREVE